MAKELKQVREKQRLKRNQKRRDLGLCIDCGKKPNELHKVRCLNCLINGRKENKKAKQDAKDKGLCLGCRNQDKLPNNVFCKTCWLKGIARRNGFKTEDWKEFGRLLELQNYTCPYTGEKLVIGVNASIDHIKPKSRFPHLISDFTNIEWVSFEINMAKRDKTKEEFIEMCEVIVTRCRQ